MVENAQGNLLNAPAEALVNAVNTVGVMGRGIALQFRQAFPEMYRAYQAACKAGEVVVGRMNVFDRGEAAACPRWIINFPTKRDWREPSRLVDVDSGLIDLVATIRRLKICSIAIPPLGCRLGGLDWDDVHPRIEQAFAEMPNVHVLLFAPVPAAAIN